MATIAKIHSKLTLNTKDFRTGFQKAKKQVQDFGRKMGRATMATAKFGAAMTTAAIGGLAYLSREHMKSIDQTAKLARSIGMTTESLTGLRYAANLAGVEQERLDKSLQNMVRRIGEADQGNQTYAGSLERIGLKSSELAGMSPDAQFKAIADGISGLSSRAEKAAVAYDLFGREGIALLNVLDQGSAAIAAQQAEAERLGLTFNAVDAAKVEAANDAMSRAQYVLTGLGQTLAIELAPYIQAAADKFTSMATEGEGAGSKIIAAVEWVTNAIASVADYIELGKSAFYGLQATTTAGIGVLLKYWGLLGAAIEKVANLIPGVDVEFSDTFTQMGDAMLTEAQELANKTAEAQQRFWDGANSKQVAATFDDIRAKAQEAAEATAKAAEAPAPAITDDETLNQASKLQDALDRIQAEVDAFGKSDIEMKLFDLERLGAETEQLAKARQQLEKLERLKRDQERGDAIQQILDQAEQEVRLFSLSEEQKQRLELEALGASDEQLQRFDELIRKREELEDSKSQDNRSNEPQSPNLIYAGSAEAQRLAYNAARGADAGTDDIGQKQLAEQQQTNRHLDRLVQKQETSEQGTWSLEEGS